MINGPRSLAPNKSSKIDSQGITSTTHEESCSQSSRRRSTVVCCQSANGLRTLTALLGAEINQQVDILIPRNTSPLWQGSTSAFETL